MAGTSTEVRESKTSEKRHYKKLARITIEPVKGANGGHIVSHEYNSGNSMTYHKPDQHIFSKDDGEEMMAHLGKHLGVKAEPESQNEMESADEME